MKKPVHKNTGWKGADDPGGRGPPTGAADDWGWLVSLFFSEPLKFSKLNVRCFENGGSGAIQGNEN